MKKAVKDGGFFLWILISVGICSVGAVAGINQPNPPRPERNRQKIS